MGNWQGAPAVGRHHHGQAPTFTGMEQGVAAPYAANVFVLGTGVLFIVDVPLRCWFPQRVS